MGPRAMLFGQVVHFFQIFLALQNCGNGLEISLLVNNYLLRTDDEFVQIIERYQTCSILMLGRYICVPPCLTLYMIRSLLRGAPRQGLALDHCSEGHRA